MNIDALRDLELAGVKWEISDTPLALRCARPAPQAAPAGPVATPVPAARGPQNVVPAAAPLSPDAAVAAANGATDIPALCRAIADFNHPLRAMARQVVLPHIGTPGDLMIVTDIPGADDDASGQILTGPAGELMDKMLSAIGLSRAQTTIVPLVFWRTPGGRTPTDEELKLARPLVNRLIELAPPRVILTLGTLAAAQMGGRTLPREHGTVATLDGGITVMPIYHPNFLILKPDAKRDVWTALQVVQNLLKDVKK